MEILSENLITVGYTSGINWLVILMGITICFDIGMAIFCILHDQYLSWALFILLAAAATFNLIGSYHIGGDPIEVKQVEVFCDEDYQYDQDWLREHQLIEVNNKVWTWQEFPPETEGG